MTTLLDRTLKRELRINGRPFVVALSPETLKLTAKGKRKGLELRWDALVSGETALAVALNASLGAFESGGSVPSQRSSSPVASAVARPPESRTPGKAARLKRARAPR